MYVDVVDVMDLVARVTTSTFLLCGSSDRGQRRTPKPTKQSINPAVSLVSERNKLRVSGMDYLVANAFVYTY